MSGSGHEEEYTTEILLRADLLRGAGFLSPGAAVEVAAMVADVDLFGKEVLDVGSGPGGVTLSGEGEPLSRTHSHRGAWP